MGLMMGPRLSVGTHEYKKSFNSFGCKFAPNPLVAVAPGPFLAAAVRGEHDVFAISWG